MGDVAVASFVQRRHRLPLFHRAALYGYFDHEHSPPEMQVGLDRFKHKHKPMMHTGQQKSNLEILLVSVLQLWQVAARQEKHLRLVSRQVRFMRDSRLLYKALLVWAKQSAITAHRAATWMSAVRGAVRRPIVASLSPFDESSQYQYRCENVTRPPVVRIPPPLTSLTHPSILYYFIVHSVRGMNSCGGSTSGTATRSATAKRVKGLVTVSLHA
jgi:hypothetical protein